jgi:hypothetical protein
MLFRDHDSAYTHAFDDVLEEAGVRVNELVFRSPNLNAYVERFIQSIQQACLESSSCSTVGTPTAGLVGQPGRHLRARP